MADSFNKRLCRAIGSMPNPVKDVKAYNYKYETLDQVLAIVQPALMDNGLFVNQGIEYGADGYELRTTIHDAEGEGGCKVMDSRPVKLTGDSQKDGSAETYARRYALKTVFGLCGEDDDGAAASKGQSKAYKPPVSSKQPAKGQSAPQEPRECPEWADMQKALSDFAEMTQQDKREVWKRFSYGRGADVFKRDPELCKAAIADIEAALNE